MLALANGFSGTSPPPIVLMFQGYRKKLMHNKVKDLERATLIRNVDGVREILGSAPDCIHIYPEVRSR